MKFPCNNNISTSIANYIYEEQLQKQRSFCLLYGLNKIKIDEMKHIEGKEGALKCCPERSLMNKPSQMPLL